MAVFPGGQIDSADILDFVLGSFADLVKYPHDDQFDREQDCHCVQVMDRLGGSGIAGLEKQECTIDDHMENGDQHRRVLGSLAEPRMVQTIGRETNWDMEFRNVVMPFAYMTKGPMQIATMPAMVP